MIKEKAKENSTGKMAESTMECGKKVNSMVKVNLSLKIIWKDKVNGIMVAKLDGSPD